MEHSLRTRRRRATEREIAAAALDLFESRGVRDTRVSDIVAVARVSERTFFRYFARKEDCVLVAHTELRDALRQEIDALDLDAEGIVGAYRRFQRALRGFDLDATDLSGILLRVDRLKRTEPGLLQAGLRVDAEQSAWLCDVLVQHGVDVLEARLFAEEIGLLFRQTLQHWVDEGGSARSTLASSAEAVERAWTQVSRASAMVTGSEGASTAS